MSREIFGISTGVLGSAVVLLRRKLGGLSQEKLARRIGCSGGAVRQWEKGRRRINILALQKMIEMCPDEESRAAFAAGLNEYPPEERPGSLVLAGMAKVAKEDLRVASARSYIKEGQAHPPGGASPLTKLQRKNLRSQAHTEIDMIFDRGPDETIKKIMEHLDHFAGTYGRGK